MSKLQVTRCEVWVKGLKDRSGALAEALHALSAAGADLSFIIARRTPDVPGQGVVFLTPLEGEEQLRAAREAGFDLSESITTLRVTGADEAGLGAALTKSLAEAGLNLHGLSAAVVDGRFVVYVSFDSVVDAEKAEAVLAKL